MNIPGAILQQFLLNLRKDEESLREGGFGMIETNECGIFSLLIFIIFPITTYGNESNA
ncbi:hypothetical protein DF22_001468 [Xylella fastidiosa]|nr:hypothetical protein M233_01345 [Xylella fastidiosa subsp. multiplex Griffin-1]KFA41844.1 hypothetical protein DF22_001468 [Xylella fastidiosa]